MYATLPTQRKRLVSDLVVVLSVLHVVDGVLGDDAVGALRGQPGHQDGVGTHHQGLDGGGGLGDWGRGRGRGGGD